MSALRVGTPSPVAAATTPEPAARSSKIEEAARSFEAIFVRSILTQSGCMGRGGGYGDMAVSAIADAITGGRGVGLGDLIRRSLEGPNDSRFETNDRSARAKETK
jgi:Rod binding domain-containing protein